MPPISIQAAVNYTVSHATQADLAQFRALITSRLAALASTLQVGDTVRLDNLSKAWLCGLQAEVRRINRPRNRKERGTALVRLSGDDFKTAQNYEWLEGDHWDVRVPLDSCGPLPAADAAPVCTSNGPATPEDVQRFLTEAAADALHRIRTACQQREKVLKQARAATLQQGQLVTIGGMSPAYLNGLSGTLGTITWGRVDHAVVLLDRDSTARLRKASRKYTIEATASTYPLEGIPLTCCQPA